MTIQFKSLRKFLATTATAAMFATALTPVASAASFPDVTDPYKEAVTYLSDKEIIKGLPDGTFGAQLTISRAEAAVMLVRALGLENYEAPESGFNDVPGYAANAVNVLKDLGIIHGKSVDTFGGTDSLTRGEMAKMVALTYNIPATGNPHPFNDVQSFFTDYVQAVYDADITNGTSATTFGSKDTATRGQFALFLHRAEKYEVVEPEILVSDLTGEINADNTVTITGKAEEIDKVTVVLPNGDAEISLEAEVVNGEFSVTTEIPAAGISEIFVLDGEGNVLYQGVSSEADFSAAGMGAIYFKDVTKRS